jgi:EAL domain-containing protein (putative c-di-GMP-specific phosphodiesterase class I)
LVAALPRIDAGADLTALAAQLYTHATQTTALITQPLHRPTWAVAVLAVPRGMRSSTEVLLTELEQLEHRSAQSRQPMVAQLDLRAAQRQQDDAAQAQRLRAQLMAGDVLLFAQPIVANAEGADGAGRASASHAARPLRKVEVLVRLRGPGGEVLSPAQFLPVAMRHNLMPLLDQVVIEQTLAWFSRNPQALAQLGLCCINLSGPVVGDSETAQRIVGLLQQHGLSAHQFLFEVTESQAIANPAQARDTVAALRSAGCRIAIDDFGTGQATYDYLKRYPVDFIKIDGSFVQALADDPVDRVIVESMVRVARQLGVGTVAEFVSSAELQGLVASLGVDESQGYALGAPQPLAHWFDTPPQSPYLVPN